MPITKANKQQALSTIYHDPNIPAIGTVDYIMAQPAKHGYRTVEKRRNAFKASMTTTDVLTKTIWLANNWAKRSPGQQAVTIAHEMVHVRQSESMGLKKFAARYATPRWRWIIECQAYAETIRVQKMLGGNTIEAPRRIATSLRDKYGPWMLLKPFIHRATVEVLSGL